MSCSRTPITRIVENLVVMRSEYPASIACFFAALAQALIASSLNPCRLLWVMEACCWQCPVARNVRHLWLSCLPFGLPGEHCLLLCRSSSSSQRYTWISGGTFRCNGNAALSLLHPQACSLCCVYLFVWDCRLKLL